MDEAVNPLYFIYVSFNSKNHMQKRIHIRITNISGHTDLEQELTEAVSTIVREHVQNKRWAYVGATSFQFTATSEDDPAILADAARLKELLESSDEGVVVTITGDLVGGTCSDTQLDIDGLATAVARVMAEKLQPFLGGEVEEFVFDSASLDNPLDLVKEVQRLFAAVRELPDGQPLKVVLSDDEPSLLGE